MMIYKLDNEKYELCKKYVMQVYDGNKKDIEMDDMSNSISVNDTALDDFVDAADYAIIHFGMVNQDYLTPLGCDLQFLYDEIYYQTKTVEKHVL